MTFLCVAWWSPAFALSFTVSEETIQEKMNKEFPQVIKDVKLLEPKIHITPNQTSACIKGQALTIPWISDKIIRICGNLTPEWDNQKAALWVKNFTLTQADIDGKPAPAWLIQSLNTYILPNIKPAMVYQSDKWIAKKIDSITTEDKAVRIHF